MAQLSTVTLPGFIEKVLTLFPNGPVLAPLNTQKVCKELTLFPETSTFYIGWFNGKGKIYGTVTVDSITPVSRKVRVHALKTGALIKEHWSNSDGTYLFEYLLTDEYYYVVGFDHTGVKADVIKSPVLPELMV